MSLARIISLHTLAVLLGLLLVSAAALWGLNGLRHDYGQALAGYAQLRDAYEIGSRVQTARVLMTGRDPAAAVEELHRALEQMQAESLPRSLLLERSGEVWVTLGRAERFLAQGGPENVAAARSDLNRVLSKLATLSAEVRRDVETRQLTADAKRTTALQLVGAVCGVMIVVAIVIAMSLYRSVMRPLNRLSNVAQQLAGGRFDGRVSETGGPRELVLLGEQFDRMTDELHRLYADLEQKVQTTGRKLVRSEQLAGIGALAAGVAHEINNPLGIIAGYAELQRRELDDVAGTLPPALVASLRESLSAVEGEAFRCKQIVQKLLTLARTGNGPRAAVDLAAVVRDVVDTLHKSGRSGGRTIRVDVSAPVSAVIGDVSELRQLVLNLIVNALQATTDADEISVDVRRVSHDVHLTVADTGAGIDPETAKRIFEPFFSSPRGKAAASTSDRTGTGLGLSICDAIVRAHGGTIASHSAGLGSGSQFVVTIPAIGVEETR